MSDAMIQVVYSPPPGSPPFEFVYSSTRYIIQPPDQRWKEIDEDYVIGSIFHEVTKTPIRNYMGKRKRWVVDEEATAAGDLPDNVKWISESCYHVAKSAANAPLNRYIHTMKDIDARTRIYEEELSQSASVKKAEAERAHHKELQQLAMQHEQQKMALIKQKRADLAAAEKAAKEAGIDLEELKKEIAARKTKTK